MCKKLCGIILVLAIGLSLAGCEGSSVKSPSSQEESAAPSSSQIVSQEGNTSLPEDTSDESAESTPPSIKTVAELNPSKIEAIPGMRKIETGFDYSQYIVVSKDNKKGIADYDGNILLPVVYDKIELCFEGIIVDEEIYSDDLKTHSPHGGHGLEHPILVWDTVSDRPFDIYRESFPLNKDFENKTPLAVECVKISETPMEGYTQYELSQFGPFYGFMKDLKLITDLEFYSVHEFSEGLAAVRNHQSWGYINETGALAIGFQFDDIPEAKVRREPIVFEQKAPYDFSNGYAGVCWNGKWGYIDNIGRRVTKFIYSEAVPAYDNKGWVCDENQNWQLIHVGLMNYQIDQ